MKQMLCKPATIDAVKEKKPDTAKAKPNTIKKKKSPPQEELETSSGMGILFALEPRIMFDGAALATGAEVLQETTPQDQTVIPGMDGEISTDSTNTNDASDNDALWSSGLSLSAPSDSNEIVFIDTRVEDYQTLMEGIDPNAEVILLDSTRDGVEQIAEILSERTDIDAIHLIAEGNEAELHLGNTFLTQEAISGQYADLFTQIGQSLSADADLLIYGCNFGQGEDGLQAMESLAELTGADIAASTDRTGHVTDYADWELEASTGYIETSVVIGEATQEAWEGVLATYTVTNTDDSGAGSFRQAILDANANLGTDTITFNISDALVNGAHTVDLLAALPDITDTIIIDGTGEPDYAGTPIIELNGTSAGAGVDGLRLVTGSDGSTIQGLVLNRFSSDGIEVNNSDNNTIAGNYIGTDVTGLVDLGNGQNGIYVVSSTNTLIGGSTVSARNVIAGNTGVGIRDEGSSGTTIQGNYIGVDATGTATLANSQGITAWSSTNGVIGGSGANESNVIGGNSNQGILLYSSSGYTVQGNYIGTDSTGTLDLGNLGNGIAISTLSTNHLIGGTGVGEGNVIAFNALDGITVSGSTSTGNSILGNQIYSNADLGIDLISVGTEDVFGVSANDAGDADTGVNLLQNYPVLTAVNTTGSQVSISGMLNSTASTTFRIEFYASATADGSGSGEAERFLGYATVTTDGSGNATINETQAWAVASGEYVTATATVIDNVGQVGIDDALAYGNTSEFAQNVVATTGPVNMIPGAQEVTEDTALNITGLSVNDVDGNLSTVELAVANGTLNVTLSGTATISAGANGSNTLTLSGMQADINATLASLSYQGTLNYTGADTLTITSTDATSATDVDTVAITVTDGQYLDLFNTNSYSNNDGTENWTGGWVETDGAGAGSSVGNIQITGNELSIRGVGNSIAREADLSNATSATLSFDFRTTSGVESADPDSVIIEISDDGGATWTTLEVFDSFDGVNAGSRNYDISAYTAANTQIRFTVANGYGGPDEYFIVDNVQIDYTPNDVPVNTVPGGQTVAEDTALNITGISVNDVDGNLSTVQLAVTNGTLNVTLSGSATISAGANGSNTLTLAGTEADINATLASLIYQGSLNYTGADNLTIISTDAEALTDTDTVGITVTAVNDAPVLTNGGTGTIFENASGLAPFFTTGTMSDPDSGDFAGGTLTFSVASGGDGSEALSLAAFAGVTTSGSDVLVDGVQVGTFTGGAGGTPLVVTFDANATSSRVESVFKALAIHVASENPTSGLRNLEVVLTDGDGGTSNIASASATFSAVNDDPTNAGSLPTDLVFLEDTQGKLDLSSIDLSDVDANAGNLTLTITSDNGHLQTLGWPGVTLGGSQSQLILTGNLTDLNDFLNDTNSIDYEHATPNMSGDNVDLITIEITDNGNTGSGGGSTLTLGTINIDITAVNDAPVLDLDANDSSGQTGADYTNTFVSGGPAVAVVDADAILGDVDSAMLESLIITLTNNLDGADERLGADSTGTNISVGLLPDGSIILSGIDTVANYQQVLRTMTYDNSALTPNTTTRIITFVANDGANDSNTATTTITFGATNAAPVNTVPGAQVVAEDTALGISGISVNDTDGNLSTMQLAVTNGTLTVTLSGAASISAGTNGTNTLTLSGTQADINATLASLTYQGTLNYIGVDTLTVLSTDALGGSDTDTVAIAVGGGNEAPVLSGANDLTAISEDDVSNGGTSVSALLSGWVADNDAGALSGIAVTAVDNTNGTWEYSTDGGSTWVAFVSPSESAARLLAADVDTFVRFVPDANWNGTVTNGITFYAWDQTSGTAGGTVDLNSSTLLDQFSTVSYSNNDGTASWTSDWVETSDNGLASTGNIRIENNKLHIDNLDGGDFESVSRSFDLSGTSTGTLTFDYDGWCEGTVDGDRFTVEVSDDGGATWTLLEEIIPPNSTNFSGTLTYSLDSYVSLTANMEVRFSISMGFGGTTQHVNLDNVQITAGGTNGSTAFSTATASSDVTVTPVNDSAVITGDVSYSGNEGDAVAGDMDATDVDGLTDGTYFTVTTPATQGTAAIDPATGAWTFTPTDPNWFGTDSFTVTVTDDQGGTTTQVMSITLANVNDAATIGGQTSYTGNEGDTGSGTLTATDADGLTDGTIFSVTTPATQGTAAIDPATGAWTFTPTDPNWFGTDSFTVTVTDDQGGTTTQVMSITLANVNDAATIGGQTSYTGNEGDTGSGTLTATDADGLTDGTIFSVTTPATQGTAAIDPATGAWTFTPTDPNWFGTDSFTVTVTDDQGGTTTQVMSITLANVNDAATIGGQTSYTGNEGDTGSGTLTATDADGLTDGTIFSVTTPATQGTAAIDPATGAWTFTPTDPNWFGTDSFTVTVTDDQGGTTTQVMSITLANVNDAATIGGQTSYTGNEGDTGSGTLTATDADGLTDGTIFSVTTPATQGTAAIDPATGAWTFTPTDPNWFGTDSFTVTVTDDQGGLTTQVMNITLANVNDAATIGGQTSYTGNEGDTGSGTLTATDADGLTDGTIFSVTTPATQGTAAIDPATGAWTFTPTDPNWFGTDSFTVTVTDDQGGTTTQVMSITLANVNDAATIGGQTSYTGNEGDTGSGTLTATDADGLTDGTIFSVTSAATQGTAAIDPATGAWTYTPTDPNWFGSDSFTVTVTDDQGGTTTQVMSITLANVNDAATIGGQTSYTGNEGDVGSGTLTATDLDGLTDGTIFSVTSAATQGTAAIDPATGAWTYTPTDPNWFGSDSFTVTVTDDQGGLTTQVMNITLANVNDPATIGGQTSYTGNEGDVGSGTLTATDLDGLTDGTIFSVTSAATQGTAAIDPATGAWTYTPTDPNWFGSDSFTVTVTDDQGGLTTQVMNITLANVNDPATIGGQTSYTGNEGDVGSGTLTATDLDGLTDGTIFSVTSAATQGTAAIDPATGAWTYTPTDPNWFGSDSFTVTVTDDQGGLTTQVMNITLANVNDPATIGGQTSYTGNEGDVGSGTLTATDLDGLTDGTIFSVTSAATQGTAAIDPATGAWTYTPTDPNWFGSDSFTVTVTDDQGGLTTQVMNITLANVNDPATIGGQTSYTGNEGDVGSGTLTATDLDGLTDGTIFSVTSAATQGTAAIDPATGAWTYTPTDPNWFGSDSFTVTVTDDQGGLTTQVMNITLANVNDPATIGGQTSYTGNEGDVGSGTLTATDLDGLTDGTIFSVTSAATQGTAAIDPATGAWTYTPTDPNWFGSDSFTVTVTDDQGGLTTQVMNITLANVNDPATIGGQTSYTGNEGDVGSGTLTATDLDGLTDGTIFSVTSAATQGTAAIDPATGAWTYTPTDPNWFGSDSFTVTVTDDQGGLTTQVMNITLANVNDPATIGGQTSYTGNEGDVGSGTLTATDLDGLTDGTIFSVTSAATQGTAAIDPATGAWTYTPTDPNWFGSDSFTVTVTDDQGGLTTQVMNITLANVNDPATIGGQTSYTGNEGDVGSGTLTATDLDGLTDGTIFSVTSAATQGTAAIDPATGAWTYTPTDPNWFGSDSFTVTVTDDQGGLTTQVMSVTLANVNDVPVAVNDSYTTSEDTPLTTILATGVLANDTDVDLDTLTVNTTPVVNVTNGILVLNADGSFTYTPNSGFSGLDTFTYQITDGNGGSAQATVTLTVVGVNDAPVITSHGGAGSATLSLAENLAGVTTMIATDVDGDPLTYSIVGGADAARFTLDPITGALRFIGAPDFENSADVGANNVYDVQVQVSDGQGGTDTQSLAITVTDVMEGSAPPLPPEPTPEPIPEPTPESTPETEPEPEPDPGILPSDTESTEAVSAPMADGGLASRGFEEEGQQVGHQEVVNVLDLPPFLRPASWATTSDQIRSYYPDPLDMTKTELSLDVLQQLNKFSDELGETMQEQADQRSRFMDLMKGTSLTLSAGLVAWLVRGGALVAGFMAVLPAWRHFDPVPILNMNKKDKEDWTRRVKEAATLEAHEHHGLDQILQGSGPEESAPPPAPSSETKTPDTFS